MAKRAKRIPKPVEIHGDEIDKLLAEYRAAKQRMEEAKESLDDLEREVDDAREALIEQLTNDDDDY